MASATPNSSASTIIGQPDRDVEVGKTATAKPVGHFSLVFNPAGVDSTVMNYSYPGDGTPDSPYIVDFLPNDPHNAHTFPKWKKWSITILHAIATLAVAFVSTAFSGGIIEVIRAFHISQEVAILGISLFVLGFAVGPLIWAPLSGMFTCPFSLS